MHFFYWNDTNYLNILEHKKGRAFFVFTLYLSEGAPIGFIWWALPTILRDMKVNVESITSITALLVLPWVFKFLWAPLVDTLRNKRFGFKSWIFFSQLIMAGALVPLVFISPVTNLPVWIACLVVHSLAAATQDVSIDAMVINTVAKQERGILNGYMQAGMLTGRSLFGGGALIMLNSMGLGLVMLLMIGCICITMTVLFFVKEPEYISNNESRFKSLLKNLSLSFSKRNTWFVILFALTSAAAFEVAGGLAGPFLKDMDISKEKIGFFFFVPVVVCMLLGGLIGGWLSDRMSRKKAVSIFLLGFVFFVALLGIMPYVDFINGPMPFYIAFGGMYLFVGMFTTSSYALFMDQTNPKIGATQFSTYMAATNGCEAWAIWAAGKITGVWDYSTAFLIMCLVSLTGLFVLKYLSAETK